MDTIPRNRRLPLALAAALSLIVGSVVASHPTASFAAQTLPPHVLTVEADEAPVLAGTGTSWSGPAVAILDSGVDPHNDYTVAGGYDCTGAGTYADGNGHGTGVAGFIAAKDNGSGTVGVAPGAPIYSVRVLDSKLKGTVDTIVCGLEWVLQNATALDIKVVNLSFATYGTDDSNCGATSGDRIHRAVCALANRGIVLVGSAGNTTEDLARFIPAAYDEVLTVTNVADYDGAPGGRSSSTCADTVADDSAHTKSNFAVSAADAAHTIAAPGTCPYTTKKGNRYGYIQSGTSMSAAAMSGVALNCLRPGGACVGLSNAGIHRVLIKQGEAAAINRGHRFAGDPLSPVQGRYYGYLASTVPGGSTPTAPVADTTAPKVALTSPTGGQTVSGDAVPLRATASDDVGVKSVSVWAGSTFIADLALGTDGSWQGTFDSRAHADGTYSFTAKAVDAAGNTGVSAPVSVVIDNPDPQPQPQPDTTAPTAAILDPADGSTISGTVLVRVDARDNVGVTSVSVWSGTKKLLDLALKPNGYWEGTTNTAAYRNGTYPLHARAADAAGNVGTSATSTVRVAN